MLSVREIDVAPATALGQAWEQLVRTTPSSGMMQSLHWAAFKQACGLRTLHLVLENAGELLGGALLQIPAHSQNVALLVAPDGPVLPWADPGLARSGLRLLRQAAEERAARYGAVGVRIEPRLTSAAAGSLLRDWGRAPVDLLPQETLYLDLRPAPSAILAQMKPKGRYNIGLAARRGVTIHSSTDHADLGLLYSMLQTASLRDGFFLEPPAYFAALLDAFVPHGLAQMVFASADGELLAGLLLICYGERATYLYGGTANERRDLMAGYALQWGAIMAARTAGCTTYDFYGYEPYGDPSHLYANFSRFKRAFGGTPQQFIGAHDFYWPERLADLIVQAINETLGSPSTAGS